MLKGKLELEKYYILIGILAIFLITILFITYQYNLGESNKEQIIFLEKTQREYLKKSIKLSEQYLQEAILDLEGEIDYVKYVEGISFETLGYRLSDVVNTKEGIIKEVIYVNQDKKVTTGNRIKTRNLELDFKDVSKQISIISTQDEIFIKKEINANEVLYLIIDTGILFDRIVYSDGFFKKSNITVFNREGTIIYDKDNSYLGESIFDKRFNHQGIISKYEDYIKEQSGGYIYSNISRENAIKEDVYAVSWNNIELFENKIYTQVMYTNSDEMIQNLSYKIRTKYSVYTIVMLIFILIGMFFVNILVHSRRYELGKILDTFYKAMEKGPTSVVITDSEANIEYVNERFKELSGYTEEEVKGKNARILKSGVHDNLYYREFWNTIKNGKSWRGEFINQNAKGEYYDQLVYVTSIKDRRGDIIKYIGIGEDRSEVKQLEEEISIQRQYFEQAFNNTLNAVVITDNDMNIMKINSEFEKIFGYDEFEVVGKSLSKLICEKSDCPEEYKILNSIRADGFYLNESSLKLNKNKEVMKFNMEAYPLVIKGEVLGLFISYKQITESQIKAEKNDIYEDILTLTSQGILILNKEGEIVWANEAMKKKLKKESLVGENIREFLVDKFLAEKIGKVLSYKEKWLGEVYFLDSEGGRHLFVENTVLLERKEETLVGVITFDITKERATKEKIEKKLSETENELKKAFESIRRAQNTIIEAEKLSTLGDLVGGMMHEINTPVGVAITASTYLKEQTEKLAQKYRTKKLGRSDFEEFVEAIIASSDIVFKNLSMAGENIKSFKRFAIDQTGGEKRIIIVSNYLKELIKSLTPKLKRTKHKIELICKPELAIESYPGLISQILTNFIMNSIKHGFEGIEEGNIKIEIKEENDSLLIIYEDDGVGIEKEKLKKIFDPYFTTKRDSGGSGLGLSIVYGIVKNKLNGEITATGEKGSGIKFEIKLPKDAYKKIEG